jgi:allantoinase
MFDLLIKNGTVVLSQGAARHDIGILGGKIAALGWPGSLGAAAAEIDAAGLVILPGLIDAHVHGGHGDPDRETFHNASMAAAAGGITTILEQPLSNPSTVTVSRLKDKLQSAQEQFVVDFSLWGGLVPGHLADLAPMAEFGAKAYKSFMCRCSNYPMTDDGTLLAGMKEIAELGGLVAVHAENDTLMQQLIDQFKAEGRNDVQAYLDSHPEYTELEAINRFIFFASLVPECKAHIVHMSIPDGAEAIKAARARGVSNLSFETCPQYLGLSEDDLLAQGGVAKCDPPVRSRESVEKLWQYVLDGTVDIIAGDHSPHAPERKQATNGDFWTVSEGVTSLQTLLPVVLTEGRRRGLTWERLAELCSTNPARLFGLYGRKGAIGVGFDADLVLLDPEAEWELRDEDLFYLHKNSPYTGRTFKGKVKQTLVRGTTVYREHEITVEPGFGRFYPQE